MIVLPAIDIKDGKCVRLTKGAFDTVEQVADDPLETALRFKKAGAEWVHMVDLDGALEGRMANAGIFTLICKESGLKVELGGGIRDMKTLEYYISNGVDRAVLGTAALREPSFVKDAVNAFGDAIGVGIDAAAAKVRVAGWVEDSDVNYLEFAKRMEAIGVKTVIFTDITRDGTLAGPNFSQLAELKEAVGCDIVASGGVATLNDITGLAKMGLYGAICGKAIYNGAVDLEEAVVQAAKYK
ncbi:MAG: 1-(5-phosphoribosyl)-5-[(5-phosphoribosylamino)methylideneamino]imidazole-4-carboxamide isomerase [Clostridiales Family XIII bacterium]|jgi:phosphoribosylformimino-5-aminoimidazole carboxamide ribotide isomerase|nr:1-(5-phosphoribosyl)-5-[(5-phosphoribosylamino)methylideneamino]imidazole-4-carboxamide isomerase [Clostridiales Family XIII bacterium]